MLNLKSQLHAPAALQLLHRSLYSSASSDPVKLLKLSSSPYKLLRFLPNRPEPPQPRAHPLTRAVENSGRSSDTRHLDLNSRDDGQAQYIEGIHE